MSSLSVVIIESPGMFFPMIGHPAACAAWMSLFVSPIMTVSFGFIFNWWQALMINAGSGFAFATLSLQTIV